MTDLIQRLRATRRFGPDDFEMLREAADQLEANAALIALLRASLRKVEDEVEGLRVDAERYRHLRDFGKDGVNIKPPCEHVHACLYSHPVGSIPATRVITGNELDAAIDAALVTQKEGS